jgi:hypothetical protein
MWRVAIVVVALVGCSNPPELTCALLADPSNCFAQQAAALAACIPMRAMPGMLSSDQMTCTFADGVYIEFSTPLPSTDVYSGAGLRMTVYAPDGSTCGSLYYDESSDGALISVNKAAIWDEFGGSDSVKLYCPSNKTYEGGLSALKECGPYVDVSLSSSTNSVTLRRTPASVPLFTCQP